MLWSEHTRRATTDALFLFPPRRSEAVKGMADDISECSEKVCLTLPSHVAAADARCLPSAFC